MTPDQVGVDVSGDFAQIGRRRAARTSREHSRARGFLSANVRRNAALHRVGAGLRPRTVITSRTSRDPPEKDAQLHALRPPDHSINTSPIKRHTVKKKALFFFVQQAPWVRRHSTACPATPVTARSRRRRRRGLSTAFVCPRAPPSAGSRTAQPFWPSRVRPDRGRPPFRRGHIPPGVSQIENMFTGGAEALIIASIDGPLSPRCCSRPQTMTSPSSPTTAWIRDSENVNYYATFGTTVLGRPAAGSWTVPQRFSAPPTSRATALDYAPGGRSNIELFAGSLIDNNAFFFFNRPIGCSPAADR